MFPNQKVNITKKEQQLQELKSGVHFMEKYIEKNKINLFKTSDNWNGDNEDLSLFTFYKKISLDCANLQKEIQESREDIETAEDTPENGDTNNNQDEDTNQENPEQLLNTEATEQENREPRERDEPNISETLHLSSGVNDEDILAPLVINPSQILKIQVTPIKQNNEGDQPPMPVDDSYSSNSNVTLETTHQMAGPSLLTAQLPRQPAPNEIIPSPFKRVLFWPEPKKPSVVKRKVDKVPAVASSKEWQIYYESKENKKKQLELEKEKRAEERHKKKEQNDTLKKEKLEVRRKQMDLKKNLRTNKKRKYSSSSEEYESWVESGSSINDVSSEECSIDNEEEKPESIIYKEGEYVLVKFPGQAREHKYVCIIQKVFQNSEAEVLGMNYCEESKTVFRPNDKDISVVKYNQILNKLPTPKIVISGERLKYHFPDAIDVDG